MNKLIFLLVSMLLVMSHFALSRENSEYMLVSSREMALELSYVYVKNIYGQEKAESQQPYNITDDSTKWIVVGKQPEALGGNFTIVIAKKDGEILDLVHTK